MKKINIPKILPEGFLDVKNLNKNILIALLGIWVVVAIVMSFFQIRLKLVYTKGMERRIVSTESAVKAVQDFSAYSDILKKTATPEKISYYDKLFERDMFIEIRLDQVVDFPPVFEIQNIEKLPLSLMYKGFIQYENGMIAAQINEDSETRFVKKGDKIKSYKVIDVTKDEVVLLGPENFKILLKLNKVAPSNEYQVIMFDSANKRTYKLKKNESLIGKYKIIDIKDDYVIILKDNENITLKKGEKLNG